MELPPGYPRLAIALAATWFVIWTYAYVSNPLLLGPSPSASLVALRVAVTVVLAATAVLVVRWIVAGFRSGYR